MRSVTRLPELLAPAGSYKAMLAAVEAGADAVYMAGKAFGARAYAPNFDEDELRDAIRYCHLHGVRVYITVNTLVYDRELDEAVAFCRQIWCMGADAVICADLGLIRRLRQELPSLTVHASTQMSVHSTEGARAAAALGITRVVVARELSERNIRSIVQDAPTEVEVFVHGALCVCHSGQCLFSSLVGGRSGNRGACAQPCRLPYGGEGHYPLSLKDLSLARHVRALIDAGVTSLKIEGRMKSPDYVYGVTAVYRRLLDEGRAPTAEEDARLRRLFSRDGFTDAYFRGAPSSPMTGVRTEENKQDTRALVERTFLPLKKRVRAQARFVLGEPCRLTLSDGTRLVTVEGAAPSAAENAPLNSVDLTTRLCKMGNTYLELRPEDVELSLQDGLFLPPSAVNALRRAAADALMDTGRAADVRVAPPTAVVLHPRPMRTAQFFDARVFAALGEAHRAFFDVAFVPLFPEGERLANGVSVPPVVPDDEWDEVMAALKRAHAAGVTYALVGNIGQIRAVRELGFVPVGDFRLNITNAHTAHTVRSMGVETYLLSPELTLPMMRDIGGGAIVYGRIPLMITERCFARENGGCRACGRVTLTDRKGKVFPVLREHRHRSLIVNAIPTYMGDRREALVRCGIVHEHFLFTTEDAAQIASRLTAYCEGRAPDMEHRRI